jgi:GNAT superfamily N-acetyltransferase
MSEGRLVGYFNILADSLTLATKEVPPDCPYTSAPALKLGRMGVDNAFRRQGVGPWILKAVVGIARGMAQVAGVRYVTLDALPRDTLVNWYARHGFVRNEGQERRQRALRLHFRKTPIDEPLPTVSMRLDILSADELFGGGLRPMP